MQDLDEKTAFPYLCIDRSEAASFMYDLTKPGAPDGATTQSLSVRASEKPKTAGSANN